MPRAVEAATEMEGELEFGLGCTGALACRLGGLQDRPRWRVLASWPGDLLADSPEQNPSACLMRSGGSCFIVVIIHSVSAAIVGAIFSISSPLLLSVIRHQLCCMVRPTLR